MSSGFGAISLGKRVTGPMIKGKMDPPKEHKEIMKGMLSELEQAIKEFMRIAKEKGMSKKEINDLLKLKCDTTLDEIQKSKIIH